MRHPKLPMVLSGSGVWLRRRDACSCTESVVAQGAKYQMSVVWAVSTRNKGKTESHLNVLSKPGV